MVQRGEEVQEPMSIGNGTKKQVIVCGGAEASENNEDQHTFDHHERLTPHAFVIVLRVLAEAFPCALLTLELLYREFGFPHHLHLQQ